MTLRPTWQPKVVKDLATINYGRSPSKVLDEYGIYPVLGTGGVERLGNDYLYEGDSIILGRKGTIDRVFFTTGRFWTIDTAYYLSNFNDALPRWLFYFLQTLDLRQMNEATGVPSLARETLYKIQVPTPPAREQEKIAEILLTVDSAIEQMEALIAKQERIKTGLMQDLLTRGIDEHGNFRSESTHKFKDSPLGRIPAEWEVAPFESRLISSAFGPRFPSTAYSESGNFALLRTTDLDAFGNIAYDQMPRAALDEMAFGHHRLEQDDLLISRSGTIGVSSVFDAHNLPVIPGAFMIRFRMDRRLASPSYWRFYFNWQVGRHRLEMRAEGGVQKNLRGSDVRNMLIAFPSVEEQNNVYDIFRRIDSNTRSSKYLLGNMNLLKVGLMQDLLTGKKRVTPLLG
jgi:type I restriction enzyme S subunit